MGSEIGSGRLALVPALEINFNLVPDQGLWGVWLFVSQEIAGRTELRESDPETPAIDENRTTYAFAGVTGILLGTYVTIAEKHQILLGLDVSIANNPEAGERRFNLGSVALGYNVVLTDAIELITEASVDIPQGGESASFGLMLGFIATLPGAP